MPRFLGNSITPPVRTTAPSAPVEGSEWYNNFRGTVHRQQTSDAIEIFDYSNVVPSSTTSWSKVGQAGTVSSATPTASTAFYIPLWPSKKCVLEVLAYEVTVQGVSASGTDRIRFGLYAASQAFTYRPTTLLSDFGDADLEVAAGVYTLNISDVNLDARLYWLSVVRQTTGTIATPAQVRMQVGATSNYQLIHQTGTTPAIGTDAASYGYYTDTQTGALTDAGVLTPTSSAAPVVLVKLNA